MLRHALGLLLAVGGLSAFPNSATADQGQMVPMAELPAAVQAGAESAAPMTDWALSFKFGKAPGEGFYRVVGRDVRSRLVYVHVRPDGKAEEVHTRVDADDVPAAVREALEAGWPGFSVSYIEVVGRTSDEVLGYRIEGKTSGGRQTVVLIHPDGRKALEER